MAHCLRLLLVLEGVVRTFPSTKNVSSTLKALDGSDFFFDPVLLKEDLDISLPVLDEAASSPRIGS